MSNDIPTPAIHRKLLAWFVKNQRDLPWRTHLPANARTLRDPYRVLVSELMLQQTQVLRVLPKFSLFIKQWPTFASLAKAKQSDVVIAWAGLGYNRRAKYLWLAAREITEKREGDFPTNPDDMERLPGIGTYTSRALRVFALGEETYMVDTNIRRVIRRVFLGDEEANEKSVEEVAAKVLPKGKADTWHQCLMDFGSAVCLSIPHCDVCPVARVCQANTYSKRMGFSSFATFLASRSKQKRGKSLPFRHTDRYFRGRIIDFLRSGDVHMEKLQKYVCEDVGLADRVRFGNLIESLMGEQMIEIKGSTVRLKD